MENYTTSYSRSSQEVSASRTFLNQVFLWMGAGLTITAVLSYLVANTPSLLSLLVNERGMSILGYIIMFAPLGFVLIMSFAFNKLSYSALVGLFLTYSAIMGISLSFIFLVYTSGSIYTTFGVSAAMFAGMGAIGYITKTDLTKMGNILMMALLGIIIASVVNWFMKSDTLSYVISFISVIVFCGLTAWDVQKLKHLSEEASIDPYLKSKLGIMGALTLYIDFINIFLSMLRLFGNRRNDY